MRKTTRNLIRKAYKLKLTIDKGTAKNQFNEFLNLFKKAAKRGAFISNRGLEDEFNIYCKDNQAIIILAKYKNELLAGALIIFYGNQAIYHYAASSFKIKNIPASYLVQWEAIKEAKKRKLKYYNFWGGISSVGDKSHPWSGLTLFKKGFGGELVEYVHAQDLPLSFFYKKTFFLEKTIKYIRGYSKIGFFRAPIWFRKLLGV